MKLFPALVFIALLYSCSCFSQVFSSNDDSLTISGDAINKYFFKEMYFYGHDIHGKNLNTFWNRRVLFSENDLSVYTFNPITANPEKAMKTIVFVDKEDTFIVKDNCCMNDNKFSQYGFSRRNGLNDSLIMKIDKIITEILNDNLLKIESAEYRISIDKTKLTEKQMSLYKRLIQGKMQISFDYTTNSERILVKVNSVEYKVLGVLRIPELKKNDTVEIIFGNTHKIKFSYIGGYRYIGISNRGNDYIVIYSNKMILSCE